MRKSTPWHSVIWSHSTAQSLDPWITIWVKIFENSSVERISRKQFIYSHVQKFTPPVSAFMFLHLLSNTLTSKSFTFSRIKKRKWLRTGCLSEILPNCVRVVLYEWHLVNYNICLFLVHNLRTSVRVNRDGEGEIWSWRLLVLNSCQNDNACEPSYTKSKVYNMDKAE